ncbi:MAG: hypothetical protein JO316_03720 [Abitibacteriaceae bacterium]|nr:hypothetical protein [Abditibacteriaceae bacterium]
MQGNSVGTNAAGSLAVPNGAGVAITGSDNAVGGATAGAGNLISGNNGDGIFR